MQEPGKKPIIFVFSTAYHPFIGGAEVAIEQVAKRLKNEFDFVIFTSWMRRDLPKREARDDGLVVRLGLGNKFDKFLLPILGCLAAIHEITRIRARSDAKIIFWAMDLSFGSLTAAILKMFYLQVHLVFTIQYGYGDERVARGRFGFMNLAFRLILLQADYVTAISSYLMKLCNQYGFIGEQAVIHNGVDLKKVNRRKEPTPYPTVITVSRLVPKNGVDVLIRAIAELKKETLDIKLHIVGDGSEFNKLQLLTSNLQLQSNVKFFGSIPYDELPKYLAEADIFVRPSRSEGMGNAFVEALAAGLPIIGTPVGGILDIIKDGETGLFAKVDDPKDLAEKIKLLLENKKLTEQIVENGRKMVEERFCWDKIAQNYAKIFNHELNFKKRILIATGIFPPEVGGPATYSKILLNELPQRDFGVRVLSFGSVRRFPKILRHIAYGVRLIAYGRNADVIFAQDSVSVGLPAAIAAKILRKKFILKIVGDYAWEQGVQRFGVRETLEAFLQNKYRWEVEILRKIQKFVANHAEKIIVPSEYLKKIVAMCGVPSDKISVVYNSFAAPEIDISKENARKQLGISGRILVSAGRDVPWKGFQILRDLMPEISRQIPDTQLFILNNEPKEKLMLYLRAADVFVLNTVYEGFSHQILEAMALGVPVVTTDAGGNSELIENGESGFLVKFNDKNALKSKILDVLSNPTLAQKLAQNAKKKASEFSKERMIKETIKILL
ncbi:hypothetical protein A3C77_02145 [Candidatus Giovannonibacteria bacterium RIFCSPHIGHO2_02_FULL_45_13]|uniref:Glycosyltransferase n=1 Tax=Candidatus Giovannonibacteria bacterium RIFCSPHIGHO2_01_FULL_45_23 TaxID=1798325 RepID=A0A1F5VI66_9BACT|nr:MAG: hypothetical protein A2834_02270 [Candidatus Giovannonibacteria bacterium RIFCSPHIGHO2_01_FULL_45_23]OGF75873.1 MAG: hypothetical protein A3C77_02145 [Candidatus Giovannonibacteria bacterium RIFCSPHIGHO2_02_FULL_45_13]